MLRTTSGSGNQRLTSSGGGGGQRQVGTPSDSGWQSQSLWEEAMSKGNTSFSSAWPSECLLESASSGGRSLEPLGGGRHQLYRFVVPFNVLISTFVCVLCFCVYYYYVHASC